MPKEETATANASSSCPFCKGEYTLSNNCDGKGTPGAFHSEPACEKFLELDPLEFAIAAREAMGIYEN